ncbi:hypothetical protein ACFXPT_07490 [Streptomyces goshikiensis]|uniref:hypothetical protein n=1 Tax=Streptomyces goshikiensis TaxID=1942 RepID=UPI0036AFCB6D
MTACSPHLSLRTSRPTLGGFLAQYLTVGHLLRQLQDLDPSLPIRLAVNPDFPFAHYVGAEVVVRDGRAFIADDGQEDYLPAGARDALAWA